MTNNTHTTETVQRATLDEIRSLLSVLPEPNQTAGTQARMKLNAKGGGSDSWGCYDDLVDWFFAHSKDKNVALNRPRLVIFSAVQGTAVNHIDNDAMAKTRAILDTFVGGSAPANFLCQRVDSELRVYEMDLETPTADVIETASLDEGAGAQAIAYGMMCVEQGIDLIALSEISYANDANISALVAHLLSEDVADWVVSQDHVDICNKMTKPVNGDSLNVAVHYGGLEICAMIGAILAARMGRVPVILDTYGACTAALVLEKIQPGSTSHCIAASPQNRIHKNLIEKMGTVMVHTDIANQPVGVASMVALAPLHGFIDMALV